MKAVARGKLSLEEENRWIDHFTACSPCTREFAALRKAAQREKRKKTLAIAAVVIIVCVASWFVVKTRHGTSSPYAAVFDLNARLMFRGAGGGGAESKGPMVLRRGIADLTLYLPPGSRTGPYEVGVLTESANVLITAPGAAAVKGAHTALTARLDLTHLKSGNYLLGVRPPGVEWSYYPLVVR